MTTPIERISSLVIGTVESVAPGEIRVALDVDAPQATALNTGTPAAFPRLNSYVLIPNEAGATVGYISWIGIERSPYPKRSGFRDFGLIDLPFPLRKLSVSPVGTLTARRGRGAASDLFELSRGVSAFPSVGDQVLVPTPAQIEAIVGARAQDRRVRIGCSPLAANATVMVDPDKLFGRHLAVLGNTGSGKSCTVAGLMRWSIQSAERKIAPEAPVRRPNVRFIVLDPNGEYAKAFEDVPDMVRVFRPNADGNPFVLPAWMWNGHEWAAVSQAQPGAQRPLLMQALRHLRAGRVLREPRHVQIVRQIRVFRTRTASYIGDATGASYMEFPGSKNCALMFQNLHAVMQHFCEETADGDPAKPHLEALAAEAQAFQDRHVVPPRRPGGFIDYPAANVAEFAAFQPLFDAVEQSLPIVPAEEDIGEDTPSPFDVAALADHVDALSSDNAASANVANFVATLTLRIRSMLADKLLASVVAPEAPTTLEQWLVGTIGADGAANGQVAIIDLSLVPSGVMHIVMAVLARLVFEAQQRYRRHEPNGLALPTVLVLEEAHSFVRRVHSDDALSMAPAQLCCEAFERIAREGRKFGLGLVLSSQRPSELSPTVLAQCNTFLLHRIVNDADQNLVARLVPDNVGGLLKELPSLPSRHAILLGWATPIPVLVEIDELAEAHRPHSADPDFWDVWTLAKERRIDWAAIAADWSGRRPPPVA